MTFIKMTPKCVTSNNVWLASFPFYINAEYVEYVKLFETVAEDEEIYLTLDFHFPNFHL